VPRPFLLEVAGAGGQRGVLHQLHGIVPPGDGLLVLEGDLSRLAVPLRAAPLQVPGVGALRQVRVALGPLGRLGFLVFLFNFAYLSQGPVEGSLKKVGIIVNF
jgi:hypothetical protein